VTDSVILLGKRRKRKAKATKREPYVVQIEHVANPPEEQCIAWDTFWSALITDLRPLVMERVRKAKEAKAA
jgi:hypothetical protein